jgi:hypothetical protein
MDSFEGVSPITEASGGSIGDGEIGGEAIPPKGASHRNINGGKSTIHREED